MHFFVKQKSPARLAGLTVIVLSWLLLACGIAEIAARLAHARAMKRGAEFGMPLVIQGNQRDDDIWRAHRGGNLPPKDADVWTAVLASPHERAAKARERKELYIICGQSGEVEEVTAPAEPAYLVAAAASLATGDNPCKLLSGDSATDCQRALANAGATALQGMRYYPAQPNPPLVDATDWALTVGKNHVSMLLTLRPSMWEIPFQKLRPNQYLCDSIEQFINAEGWRNGPVQMPKPDGVIRIVCIGGSTTMEGRTNELTYPAMLQNLLRQQLQTEKIEVINCGVNSFDSNRELALLPNVLRYQPDFVLHYNFVNDLPRLLALWTGDGRVPVEPTGLQAVLRRSTFLYRFANRWLLPGDQKIRHDLEADIITIYKKITAQASEEGAEMLFCSFAYPDPARIPAMDTQFFDYKINHQPGGWPGIISIQTYAHLVELHNEQMARYCRGTGIPYIPLAEEFTGGVDTFYDVCHLFQPGIQHKAEVIAKHLAPIVAAELGAQEKLTSP